MARGVDRTRLIHVALAVVVCTVGGWLVATRFAPAPPLLAAESDGDDALLERVHAVLARDRSGLDAMAIVSVVEGDVRFAGIGRQHDGAPVGPASSFEIGSLTKALTGMLLADLLDSGRLAPDTTLDDATQGRFASDGDGADARLVDIARHTTGWPRMPASAWPRLLLASYTRHDAYAGEADDVLATAATQSSARGDHAYSNLGYAALGHALAAHEGIDYATLLRRRLLLPLGMESTHVLDDDDALPKTRVTGGTASGLTAAPWRAAGWQPAGVGIWSTPADLSKLMVSVLAGTAPGLAATEASRKIGSTRHIGYGWMTDEVDGTSVLWHNGGTGGFRSWLGLSIADGRGIAVLSNTDRPIDAPALALLIDKSDPGIAAREAGVFAHVLGGLGLAGVVVTLAGVAGLLHRRNDDRHALVRRVSSGLQFLVLGRLLAPWDLLPVALWQGAVALLAGVVCLAVIGWKSLPAERGRSRARRRARTAFGIAVTGALIGLSP